jgi:hypothetical protein
MSPFNVEQLRTQAMAIVERIGVDEQLDTMIVGGLLVIVLALALAAIWKNRRRAAEAPVATPSNASGFTRWLTPMGMKSIPSEQAVVSRPRRKSGSNKTIKVSTPVSKVPTRALKGSRADALDIARKTGLARDAVVMMMANANPRAEAKKPLPKPAAQPATRTIATERGMTAPGAYGSAPRTPAPTSGRALGTQFNARLS